MSQMIMHGLAHFSSPMIPCMVPKEVHQGLGMH